MVGLTKFFPLVVFFLQGDFEKATPRTFRSRNGTHIVGHANISKNGISVPTSGM